MADYNAVPLVATGDWIDDVWLNTYIRDNLAALWLYAAAGDITYALDSNTLAKRAIGAANALMYSTGSAPNWATLATLAAAQAIIASQAAGDIFYGASGTALGRVAKPASASLLTNDSGGVPSWATLATAYGMLRRNSANNAYEVFVQAQTSRAYRSSGLSSTAVGETDIPLNAEDEDANWHNNATNSQRITPTETGRYRTRGSLKITNASGVHIDSVTVLIKTSTGVVLGRQMLVGWPDGATVSLSVTGYSYDLTAGQYFVLQTARANATSGVTIEATETWLEVERVR